MDIRDIMHQQVTRIGANLALDRGLSRDWIIYDGRSDMQSPAGGPLTICVLTLIDPRARLLAARGLPSAVVR